VTDKVQAKKPFAINFPKPGNGAWIFLVVFEAGIRVRASRAATTENPKAVLVFGAVVAGGASGTLPT
jgi:hypothetical protein